MYSSQWTSRTLRHPFLLLALALSLLLSTASAYQLLIEEDDEIRQVCSGMWGGSEAQEAGIEVLFAPSARGQLALVIYEWGDAKYLGTEGPSGSAENEWSEQRTYICTLSALEQGLCTENDLGRFISTSPTNSSIWTASVRFDPVPGAPQSPQDKELGTGPYRYEVTKDGWYCVGAVPVTMTGENVTYYTGVVDFENVFVGHLPAAEYPKIAFYFYLSITYIVIAAWWGFLCWQNRGEILPIQNYVSATLLVVIVEMLIIWRYYNYLNVKGHPGVAKVMLFIVAVLNAGRNSLSFFCLLITSMGYGVVRPSLGQVMLRIRLLAIVHFVFGIMYSLGTVSIPLERAGFFIFFFVFPLAFSLTAFLMWIMWSLNSTIQDLSSRKQTYKKSMFTKLYRILIIAVIVIAAFFVISSLSFSNRFDQDFGPRMWKTRWILLDGWLGILYLLVFLSIAWVWRPTANNRRLALSDELPTDEMEADAYDVDALTRDESDKDNVPLGRVGHDSVVFDVGDDESDEDDDEEERDEENDIGLNTGEHRPLRLETSDEEDRPPSYRDRRNS